MEFFTVESVSKRFGGLLALDGISLSVREGEIRGVIGPNGAGKTTFFNVVSGLYKPTAGSIMFQGADISRMRPSKIAALGVVRTFQRAALFPKYSVVENIAIARHLHADTSFLGAIFGGSQRSDREAEEKAREIVEFLHLADVRNELAANLAHGHQRILNVAMALATEPKLLMLDEPVAGMNSAETQMMTELIRKIRDERGVTVLLVEHDMRTVMGLCETITVLDFGKKLAEGLPDEIKDDPDVIDAYLGTDEFDADS
ncbi:MAG: ABC transporter ATP-binding protein [Proteobacteria bacterium]|nr:ABC transporter ATP-binding protein [Pseudomonadota bacterium]